MNAKGIEALKAIRDNLETLIEVIGEEEVGIEVVEVAEKKPVRGKTAVSNTSKTKEVAEASIETDEVTLEMLEGMTYNNLKKFAKELGISAVGARDEITQKILNASSTEVDDEDEEEEEVKPTKKPASTRKSKVKKVEEVEEEEEEEEDSIAEQVNEAVQYMSSEEIADVLADAGIKAKGKRQALVSAVIKAVKDGKIDLDGDDEDEETTEVGINDPDNEDMTDERRAAIEALIAETHDMWDEKEITRKTLIEWLQDFHSTKDKMKDKTDEELLEEYIDCSCFLISDEGEQPEEEGAYTINNVPYCCGHELDFNKKRNIYECSVCEGEYEAD